MFTEKKTENKSPLEIGEVIASPLSMNSRSPAKIIATLRSNDATAMRTSLKK